MCVCVEGSCGGNKGGGQVVKRDGNTNLILGQRDTWTKRGVDKRKMEVKKRREPSDRSTLRHPVFSLLPPHLLLHCLSGPQTHVSFISAFNISCFCQLHLFLPLFLCLSCSPSLARLPPSLPVSFILLPPLLTPSQ